MLGLCLMAGVLMVGCENSTEIQGATITDISVSGADNYGIRVSFLTDKRLENKYVDVQVKTDKAVTGMEIWEDGGTKYTINLTEVDQWQSITTIFVEAQSKPGTEQFQKFSEAISKRYLFSSKSQVNLLFRVVVGDVADNDTGKGKVLANSEPISDIFKLKVEGKNNNNEED